MVRQTNRDGSRESRIVEEDSNQRKSTKKSWKEHYRFEAREGWIEYEDYISQ